MIVEPDFLDHWKTRLLVELTNDSSAPLMVLRLWAHCQQRKKWRFEKLEHSTLRVICRSEIDGAELLRHLTEAGFVRKQGETLIVHDWEKSNRMLVSAWKNGSKGGRPVVTDRLPTGLGSDNRPLTSPSILSNLSVQKKEGTREKTAGLVDSEWLARIEVDDTYHGIDVKREFGKMANWCKVHKVEPTRRRFINWLNRVDKPMTSNGFVPNKQKRINQLNERKAELNRLPSDASGNLIDRNAGRELQRINMELSEL